MKWFTDLDESIRVRLIEEYKQQHEIDRKGEISDESAYAHLAETCWSEDGLIQGDDNEVEYLQINDEAMAIIERSVNDPCPGIHLAYEIRKLIIERNNFERLLKIWKPKER